MEKTNGQQEIKRYLIRSERFFGILYDRQQKRYRTIPAGDVVDWCARVDTDFIDYQAVQASDPRTAFGAPVL
ncbi:MAG TPA: hypothetical protein VKP08_07625, partial [Anaerolineales bacterium]|nr:hypothetical protein [Anaerolineales bacterium]